MNARQGVHKKSQHQQKFELPRRRTFQNSFKLSDGDLDVSWSPEYSDYIDLVDHLSGIYYDRWGDASIKTIAVILLIPKNRTQHIKGIAYIWVCVHLTRLLWLLHC